MTIPSFIIFSRSSANDVTITDIAISVKAFIAQQIKQTSTARLVLQECFILGILRPTPNRIMDYHRIGSKDKCSKSNYNWPKIIPSPKDIDACKQFLSSSTVIDYLFLRIINSSRVASCHRKSTVLHDLERHFTQAVDDIQQWFSYQKVLRNLYLLRQEHPPNSHQFH